DYREIRLTTERCADKRMFPYGGICLIWEVADLQLLSPSFSDDDDKQGFCVFPGKALHASKRRPLHGLAFLPEAAATQESPEAIKPSLYSGDNSWSQHVRLLLRDILGSDPPIFSKRMYKVASTGPSSFDREYNTLFVTVGQPVKESFGVCIAVKRFQE